MHTFRALRNAFAFLSALFAIADNPSSVCPVLAGSESAQVGSGGGRTSRQSTAMLYPRPSTVTSSF
jgi:hypothetical protein